MNQKPSERIKEIHRALKILDGQNPDDKNFEGVTFFEQAIIQYLNEQKNGTSIDLRSNKVIK